MTVAVIGAGWAGLACAIRLTSLGHQVCVLDAAHRPGGRARSLPHHHELLDNGQHILIGAYQHCLSLMREVGVDVEAAFVRTPLSLLDAKGHGLRLAPGPTWWTLPVGLMRWSQVPLAARLSLMLKSAGWVRRGFRCDPAWTVKQLCSDLPPSIVDALLDPLCVAALNTPSDQASAQVFLRVLQDALFGPAGSADLLLPRSPLSQLLPDPACAWLHQHGADVMLGRPCTALTRTYEGWQLDGLPERRFEQVVLACGAHSAQKLAASHAPVWAEACARLPMLPIATMWLSGPPVSGWPSPMLALPSGPDAPAQFAFDLGQLGGPPGRYALIASAADQALSAGLPGIGRAAVRQLSDAMAGQWPRDAVALLTCRAERRATFACTPDVQRPTANVAPGLWAAGDHLAGPYPATLEGAVRSGESVAQAIAQSNLRS